MITSDRQLKVTKEKIEGLKKSLSAPTKKSVSAVLERSGRLQVETLIVELQEKVDEYEHLKSGGVKAISLNELREFFLLPIKYRIAVGMSQDAFAKLVGLNTRQIARYEAEEYSHINRDSFQKIIDNLPIQIEGAKIEKKSIS